MQGSGTSDTRQVCVCVVETDELDVVHVATDENPADLFTKDLVPAKFKKFMAMVMGGVDTISKK